jgi:hypothetical protein
MIVRKIRPEELKRCQQLCALAFEYPMQGADLSPEAALNKVRQNPQSMQDVHWDSQWAAFGDDDATRAVVDAMLADGTAWTTGSRWRGRAVLRVSVSNWSTTAADVEAALDALGRAAAR